MNEAARPEKMMNNDRASIITDDQDRAVPYGYRSCSCPRNEDGKTITVKGKRYRLHRMEQVTIDGVAYFAAEDSYRPRPPRPPPVIQRPRVPQLRARPRSSRRSSRTVPAAATSSTAESPSDPAHPPTPPPVCRRCYRVLTNGSIRLRLCASCVLLLHHREGGAD